MPQFKVIVTIENKPGLSDPEGKTILKDLILKEGQNSNNNNSSSNTTSDNTQAKKMIGSKISDIRTAKMLRFTIDSSSADSAASQVREVCDRLYIYNPIVSVVHVTVDNNMKK